MEEQQAQKTIDQDFIMSWDNVVPGAFCDWLIDYLDNNVSMVMSSRSAGHLVDKQCEMHNFSPGEADYLQDIVNQCCRQYVEKYFYLKNQNLHSSCVMIQRTEPKEGYHVFHCEQAGWRAQQRALAWMVYLNDVEEGGETEFLYQQLKIKPSKGRVVIWPGQFTHLHRDNPPISTKYIATGWFAFIGGMENSFVDFSNPPS